MSYSGYHKLRTIVVDDFDSFRMTLVKMLQSYGVEDIDTAVSGADCITQCEEKKYDLILCDYNLGKGKNGQQVLEELRFKNILDYRAIFILISAESSRSIIMSAYDYEPDAYLAKPITGKVLKQRIDRLLIQRDELMSAYEAVEEGRIDEATKLLKEKIENGSRSSAYCQKRLGELYFNNGQFEEAEEIYRLALEARTLDWAKVGMAKVRHAMGKNAEAKQWLEEILLKNPLCMQAYDALVDLLKEENDHEQIITVLKRAVEYSPMAILRQEKLAQAARALNENAIAAKAYRQTVRLGSHSCHDKRDNHINFGRTTACLLKESNDVAADLCREAIKILEDLDNNFEQDEEQVVQTLFVESQILFGQGNQKKASEVMDKAEVLYTKLESVSEIETELDHVQSLNAAGSSLKADQILKDLIGNYQNDQNALEKLDRLLEEPISDTNRQKVSDLNREGIAHYELGKYKQAVDCFKNAKKMFPNHISIQLNYVQALQGEFQQYGYDKELFDTALIALNKIKRQINGAHPEYDRYLQLHDMLSELRTA